MSRFIGMYKVEQKNAFRSVDGILFGVVMPVGILVLISMIAGDKTVNSGSYTYLQGGFASLIAVGICAAAFMGLPLTVADYRDKKILKHMFVTPCSPLWILGAIIGCNLVTAILSAVAVTIASILVLGYQMEGSWLLFFGSWVLTLSSMFSIGMMIASLCRTVKTVNVVTSAVYFPMLFLSGATIPIELFPNALQKIASILPLSQGIKLMKQVSMGTSGGEVRIVIVLIAITVVCSIISVKTFRWE